MFGGRALGTREFASGLAGVSSTALMVIVGGAPETSRLAAEGLRINEVLNGRMTASLRFYQQRPSFMNLLTYSEQFDNAAWSKARSSVTANATTAPDGTTTAEKLVEDTTASNSHYLYKSNVVSVPNTVYTFSIYAKSAERTRIMMRMQEGASALGYVQIHFDLGAGTTNTPATVGGGVLTSSAITDVGSGWYRCSITGIYHTSGATLDAICYLGEAVGDVVYTGDGTSGLYLWGAQLERLDTVTAYLPTTTAARIENQPIASIGQSVFVLTGSTRRFAGTVSQIQEVQYFEVDNARHWIELKIEAVDYNTIPSRFVVLSKTYSSQTVGYIVSDLITTYLAADGITNGGVTTGATLTTYEITDKTVAEVLDDLSDIAGMIWSISPYKMMEFRANELSTAPFNLSSTSGDVRQVRTRRSRDQYRNVQIVRGSGSVLETRTDTAAITERQGVEGGGGRYEHLVSDDSAATAAQAQALGDGLLARYAQLDTEVEFETHRDGLRPGQRITLTFTDLNLSGTYLITQVDWELLAAPTMLTRSRVVANSGDVRITWLTFWKRLMEAV